MRDYDAGSCPMPKRTLRMPIARLTEDQMREIVLDRLACKVMFSGEIPTSTRSMCLLPVAMGALAPPEELQVALLGSSKPPQTLEGDPPAPVHPGHPEGAGEPPEKPVLSTVPEEALFEHRWGDLSEEELADAHEEVRTLNAARIKFWEDASNSWHDALDEESRVRREIDAAHEAAVTVWEASLPAHDDAVAARKKAHDDWVEKHDRIFAEWGANVGEIMGRMKDAFPRGVNGYPMFHAVTVIHKDDWARIETAIIREQARGQDIEV